MNDLCKEWRASNGQKQQKLHIYKEVFLTHFSSSFFNRKKDRCPQCTEYENSCVSKDDKDLI